MRPCFCSAGVLPGGVWSPAACRCVRHQRAGQAAQEAPARSRRGFTGTAEPRLVAGAVGFCPKIPAVKAYHSHKPSINSVKHRNTACDGRLKIRSEENLCISYGYQATIPQAESNQEERLF